MCLFLRMSHRLTPTLCSFPFASSPRSPNRYGTTYCYKWFFQIRLYTLDAQSLVIYSHKWVRFSKARDCTLELRNPCSRGWRAQSKSDGELLRSRFFSVALTSWTWFIPDTRTSAILVDKSLQVLKCSDEDDQQLTYQESWRRAVKRSTYPPLLLLLSSTSISMESSSHIFLNTVISEFFGE